MSADSHVDAVIVGSGFGGAVAALRLAKSGLTVRVLERGRHWDSTTLPKSPRDMLYSSRFPHRYNGWMDVRFLDQMVVATGAGVGGGSLIYANVSVNPDCQVFDTGWPSEISWNDMQPHYKTVGDILTPSTVPKNQQTARMSLLVESAANLEMSSRVEMLPLAVTFDDDWSYSRNDPTDRAHSVKKDNVHGVTQGTCVHCGNCVTGCPVDAKNTLDFNYLKLARDHKAEISPLSVVSHLERRGAGKWRTHYDDVSGKRKRRRTISSDIVVLAAGSLGSTEILLRSRDEFKTLPDLPRSLGKGWSPNGDFLTLAHYPRRKVNPTIGPTIGAAINFLDGVDPDNINEGIEGRFFVEDGGLPNVSKLLLKSWDDAPASSMKRWMYDTASDFTDFKSMIPWFGQAIDGADGEFSLRDKRKFWRGRLKLDWNPQRSKLAMDAFADTHIKLTEAAGGTAYSLLTWRYLKMLVTPHPLGGCNMSSAPAAGVVQHTGEVFGHRNLYVMDGSVVPRAIGKNPSKTIAAVAERSCEQLLKSRG